MSTKTKTTNPVIHDGDLTVRSENLGYARTVRHINGNLTIAINCASMDLLVSVEGSLTVCGLAADFPSLQFIGDRLLMGLTSYGTVMPSLQKIGGLPIASAGQQRERLNEIARTVLAKPDRLNMREWHSDCGTTHCIAGWAVKLAGQEGQDLEDKLGPSTAGALLLGNEALSHFADSEQQALDWLKTKLIA